MCCKHLKGYSQSTMSHDHFSGLAIISNEDQICGKLEDSKISEATAKVRKVLFKNGESTVLSHCTYLKSKIGVNM